MHLLIRDGLLTIKDKLEVRAVNQLIDALLQCLVAGNMEGALRRSIKFNNIQIAVHNDGDIRGFRQDAVAQGLCALLHIRDAHM